MIERAAWAAVDLGAIARNVRAIRGLFEARTAFCAVVKADAYGHGAVQVAGAALAAGADRLAVALIQEGAELRRAGIDAPILVLGRSFPEQAAACLAWRLEAATDSLENARAFSEAAQAAGTKALLHLKVDSGMARLGLPPGEAPAVAEAIARLPGVELRGMFTHFAAADEADPAFARSQLAIFLDCVEATRKRGVEPSLVHAANSAAALALPEARLDMARVGIALYGIKPDIDFDSPVPLSPAMRLKARVTALRRVPAGATVGYGRSWTARRDSLVATIPAGYADGYPRALSSRGLVVHRGRRLPIAGRVCMDMFMVDATEAPEIAVGDEVLLFGGPDYPVEDYAAAFGSIGYEATCLVGKRVPRVYAAAGEAGAGPGKA
jgi:alanine racemase